MAAGTATARGGGLLLFDVVLRALTVALAVVTVAAVPLVALFLTGRGPLTVRATIDPPYAVGFHDGRRIEVGENVVARVDFPVGEESRSLEETPSIVASVRVDRADTDSRAALSAIGVLLVALGWFGVLNARAVTRSARAGDPFVPQNVVRLRRLAVAVLLAPVVTAAGARILDRTLDADPPVDVLSPGPGGWTFVVVAFGLFGLAEVFREGSVLRRLERETV